MDTPDIILSKVDDSKNMISSDSRKVIVGAGRDQTAYCSNKVITARYTWYTWAPKSLIMQFIRVNNVYFLIISILTIFPFSPKTPYSIGATLGLVLVATMIKEAYEDIARHRQDSEVNKTIVKRYSRDLARFEDIESQNIFVGDIIKVSENEPFPADLIMISNSHPKGIAFVNTMNLDGETNLKEKYIMSLTQNIRNDNDLKDVQFNLYLDHPNSSLFKLNCNIEIKNDIEPMDMKQLLLRACVLKNTEWIIGVAVYTGPDTKIVMNSKKAPIKRSYMARTMNWILCTVFILQMVVCFIWAGIGLQWTKDNSSAAYLSLPSADFSEFIQKILTYWIGYSTLIPISLYITIEVLRLILSGFIKCDINMYYEPIDRRANVRSSDLIEELGQIEFIFSDKTGTLTCNEMEFRKCGINSKVYGKTDGKISNDLEMTKVVNDYQNPEYEHVKRYLLALALCNSVFPAKIGNNDMIYQASSPDELALVEAAKAFGYTLKERSEGKVFLEINGDTQEWEILVEIPFNSDRKRMSVITRHPKTKELLLVTKGADSVMLDLIQPDKVGHVKKELSSFAVEGLRTLVIASRVLDKNEYKEWIEKWKIVQLSNLKDKESRLDNIGSQIEKDLELIGTSAIEDRLQDGVPEAIKLLMEAQIRIWVLTGDKEETAIEIAKSCNLIQSTMDYKELFYTTAEETRDNLVKLNNEYINLDDSELDFIKLEKIKNSLQKPVAIVTNGITLSFIMQDLELKNLFFNLGFISNSCICCRVSPSQKMQVVSLCKTFGKWITLAIGDGANDVSMIQEAHIGVGIAGKEGTQAVQASDFTFCQFQHLKYLLLVHGRYAYFRISFFVLYYFYKNFLSVFTEVWLALFDGFSGQIYFLDWLPSLYNSLWTSWPCMAFFTLEKDIPPSYCIDYPNLYSAGQKSAYFNIKKFWMWIGFAFLSASWIFWLPVLSLSNGTDSEGHEPWLWWVSTVSFTMLIHTVILKLLIISHFWTTISM
jgi:phospholipid-transporting ATPase